MSPCQCLRYWCAKFKKFSEEPSPKLSSPWFVLSHTTTLYFYRRQSESPPIAEAGKCTQAASFTSSLSLYSQNVMKGNIVMLIVLTNQKKNTKLQLLNSSFVSFTKVRRAFFALLTLCKAHVS